MINIINGKNEEMLNPNQVKAPAYIHYWLPLELGAFQRVCVIKHNLCSLKTLKMQMERFVLLLLCLEESKRKGFACTYLP